MRYHVSCDFSTLYPADYETLSAKAQTLGSGLMSFYDQSPLKARIGDSRLARRLQDAIEGEVLFDAFDRGRYSTDASIYQVEPIGVVIPRTEEDLSKIIAVAADEGVPILPRGAGTSQSGQTVGLALVVDVR